MRTMIALAAVALLALVLASEASARPGGGGFRSGGGFHGGLRGGFRGFHGGFRGHGFRGHGFRGGFRHFGPRFVIGAPLVYGAYAGWPYHSYSSIYADDCLAPRRLWTSYGWRIRWVNLCY